MLLLSQALSSHQATQEKHPCTQSPSPMRTHVHPCTVRAHMHTRAHAHTHTHACTHVYARSCTHAYTRVHACTHARTHAHTHAHMYMHAHAHAHAHTHVHAHTCMHAPRHMRKQLLSQPRAGRVARYVQKCLKYGGGHGAGDSFLFAGCRIGAPRASANLRGPQFWVQSFISKLGIRNLKSAPNVSSLQETGKAILNVKT